MGKWDYKSYKSIPQRGLHMNNPVLTNNTLRVKESNTNLILDTLKTLEVATRAEIAKITGLSIATCGNILRDLVASEEILEGDLENCSGGRPARQYIYNKNFSLVIAMTIQSDITLKTLQYAVTNLYGEILEERVKAYDRIDAEAVSSLVDNLIQTHPNIKSIGIGIPGFADKDGTIGITDIEELNGVNLVQMLEKKFKIKAAIDRSPAISAYGFYENHPEYKDQTIATILTPAGHPVGAGFIINGQIYKGSFNMEGEISYIYKSFADRLMPDTPEDARLINETLFSVSAVISTLNPSVIVFMGKSFNKENYQSICDSCREMFPDEFLPEFELQEDYSDSYLKGTIQIAIDCLKPKVKLIAK